MNLEKLHQANYDLLIQYHELLNLRAEVARRCFQSNSSSYKRKVLKEYAPYFEIAE